MAVRTKLAVILHADVVGSTTLVQKDEGVAHDRIREAFSRFSEAISAYAGITHELRGDALVAEFDRASDAVSASLFFQAQNATVNEALPDDIRPEVRVGISMGEVVIADGTVTGAGVVLAQRLEQLAVPGGVVAQGAAYETIPSRLPFQSEFLGDQTLKGFDEPVRAFSVALEAGAEVPAAEPVAVQPTSVGAAKSNRFQRYTPVAGLLVLAVAALLGWFQPWNTSQPSIDTQIAGYTLPGKPSVAVLPFVNMSGDASQTYFSDGLSEDIITDLARLSGLFVIARNSSFAYRGREINMQQIGRELRVRYLVEGSVRRDGSRVRVSAQLIDTQSGAHLWADRYDRDLSDVFALQDELTRTIVDALTVNLTDEEAEVLTRLSDASPDAYDMLLRGNELLGRFSADDNLQAREYFRKAIALNPRYARAHANLAYTYALAVAFGWAEEAGREEAIRLGMAAAEEARALDDQIPQLYFTLANFHAAELQWEETARAARQSLELEPNYADSMVMLSVALTFLGSLEEAASAIEQAKQLNPHHSYIYLWVEGRILYQRKRYEEAAEKLEEAIRRNPGFDQAHIMLAATYGQLDRIDDAQWEVEEILALHPGFTISTDALLRGYRDLSLQTHYAEGLRKAGLSE